MKTNNKWTYLGLSLVFSATLLGACSDNDTLEGVDLRYEDVGKLTMQDQYTIQPDGQPALEFRVKSDHPWMVYGTEDWHTITPSTGEANKVATVKLTCAANTELDDRQDTIKIQSDYWVGHTFVVLQKGIAQLTTDVAETGIQKDKEEGTASFNVIANQTWTVEVTEGSEWVSIAENPSGGKPKVNSTTPVKLSFKANKGEERVGKITVYDRHHSEETKIELTCTQAGITLVPTIPETGYYKQTNYKAHEFDIPVESNGDWNVSKENADDKWYEFVGKTSFSGNGTVRVRLTQNDLANVRSANIVLQSNKVEGAEVVTKTVTIKQANLPKAQRTVLNAGGIGSWSGADALNPGDQRTWFEQNFISKAGFKPGTFKLHISGMKSATSHPYLYLEYKDPNNPTMATHEIRIAYNDVGRPYWTFVTPWGYGAPQVNNWCLNNIGKFDYTKDHTLELRLSQYGNAIKVEYIFDGVLSHYYITDGQARQCDVNGVQLYGAYQQPYKSTVTVKLGCFESGTYLDWFEYTPNVDWGD